jgi:hypothetical protein
LLVLVRVLVLFTCGPLAVPPVTCPCGAAEASDDGDHVPPGDADHDSHGCPALTCADRTAATVTPFELSPGKSLRDLPSPFVDWPLLDGLLGCPLALDPTSRFHESDPPLFLSHCALVR